MLLILGACEVTNLAIRVFAAQIVLVAGHEGVPEETMISRRVAAALLGRSGDVGRAPEAGAFLALAAGCTCPLWA